jgi:hypothetical protein
MRKLLAIAVIGSLLLALVPEAAMAGDPHAVRNRWAGVGIGAAVATVGGLVLGSLLQPPAVAAAPPAVVAPPPPVVYSPPPVVYYQAPVVVAPPPPVVYYRPAPVVVYRSWGPRGYHRGWR